MHFQNKLRSYVSYVLHIAGFHTRDQLPCISIKTKKSLHKNRSQFPEDLSGTQSWPPFLCLRAQIWPPWRHVKPKNCHIYLTTTSCYVWTLPKSTSIVLSCNFQALSRISYFSRNFKYPWNLYPLYSQFRHFSKVSSTCTDPGLVTMRPQFQNFRNILTAICFLSFSPRLLWVSELQVKEIIKLLTR